jgi:hypothetical protein
VPSQITGNKENNKQNDGMIGSKVALKPREFGREITNAATASSNTGTAASKNSQSLIIESTSSTNT